MLSTNASLHCSTQNFNKDAHPDELPYVVAATAKLWEINMFMFVRRTVAR